MDRNKFESECEEVKMLAEKVEDRRKHVETLYVEGVEAKEVARRYHQQVQHDKSNRDGISYIWW